MHSAFPVNRYLYIKKTRHPWYFPFLRHFESWLEDNTGDNGGDFSSGSWAIYGALEFPEACVLTAMCIKLNLKSSFSHVFISVHPLRSREGLSQLWDTRGQSANTHRWLFPRQPGPRLDTRSVLGQLAKSTAEGRDVESWSSYTPCFHPHSLRLGAGGCEDGCSHGNHSQL